MWKLKTFFLAFLTELQKIIALFKSFCTSCTHSVDTLKHGHVVVFYVEITMFINWPCFRSITEALARVVISENNTTA